MVAGATEHDVIVAGDGPAAAAVVASCRSHGLDVVAVGPGAAWCHTYGMWRDEAPDLPDDCFSHVVDRTVLRARTERAFDRPYGVIDRRSLREHLAIDTSLRIGRVDGHLDTGDRVLVDLADGDALTARWLVDATGHDTGTAWQTAYGCVVSAADVEGAGYPTDAATVMAWLSDAAPACFVYVVPVEHGWLVEVTSLAAVPAVDPQRLRRVLIDVLGEAPVVAAEALGRIETVRIPMGAVPLQESGGRVVRFGTAGGLAHPATGYSLAASLALAGRVAGAMASGADPIGALWPPSMRRTRDLHDGGLDVLLRLDGAGLTDFFEAFASID
ncbi:MAG: lycopene cyclase family protein, partial [Acidimicrobiia bacterium]